MAKMGKLSDEEKNKFKENARKLISNPKKLGGKNPSSILGISDPNRKNTSGGRKKPGIGIPKKIKSPGQPKPKRAPWSPLTSKPLNKSGLRDR